DVVDREVVAGQGARVDHAASLAPVSSRPSGTSRDAERRMPLVEIDTLDALPSQTRDRFRATLLPLPLGGRGLGMGGRGWAVASSRGPDRAESGGVSGPVLDVPRELEPPGAARGGS